MSYVESLIRVSGKNKNEILKICEALGKDTFDEYGVNIVSLVTFKKEYPSENVKCGDTFLYVIGDSYIQISPMILLDCINNSRREDIEREFGTLAFERIYINDILELVEDAKKENEYMNFEYLTWYRGRLIHQVHTKEDIRINKKYNIVKLGSSYIVPIKKINTLDPLNKSSLLEVNINHDKDFFIEDNIHVTVHKLNESCSDNSRVENCFAIIKCNENFEDLGMEAILLIQSDKSLEYNNIDDVDKVLNSIAHKFNQYKNVTLTYIETMNKEECEDYITQLEKIS